MGSSDQAFSEAYRRERGEKRKRIVPIVKPDLLAHSYRLRITIAVEVAITSNPVKEADKLELLNMEHEVARPLLVTSSYRDGWIGDIPFVSYTHLDDLLMKALVTRKMRDLERAFEKRR